MSAMTNTHTLDLNSIRSIFGTTEPERLLSMIRNSEVRELKSGSWYEIIMEDIAKWHVVEYRCENDGRVEISDGRKIVATLYQGRFFDEIKKHVEKNQSVLSWF